MAKKNELNLDLLHDRLSDRDLSYLLSLRVSMHKQRLIWDMIQEIRHQLDEGVEIVFNGQVTGRRRPLASDILKMRQAIDSLQLNDFAQAAATTEKDIAKSIAADTTVSIEELRDLTSQRIEMDARPVHAR